MWVLSAPFDEENLGEFDFRRIKLLKTGSSYPLGRKDRSLVINSKKISHDHCEFIVGKYSSDDVANPLARPTLEFVNKKNKVMKVTRGDQYLGVNPSAIQELHDGDIISIVSDISITVQWIPVCCFSQAVRGKSPVSLDACASLGINIVHVPNAHVTHHLIFTFSANFSTAASLLSACQFVKPEWLNEVIRLGNLTVHSGDADGVSLEKSFCLPPLTKFRPGFSPSLPPSLKIFKAWEPNEERFNMFKGFRFVCVGEKGREMDGDMREVINRGSGSIERFDVNGGKPKLHKALSSAQAKDGVKALVVVADEKAMEAAVGQDVWKDLVDEAQMFGVRVISPENIIQAIMNVDTSFIDSSARAEMDVDEAPQSLSPLPDFVPNTHPDEPSLVLPEPEKEALECQRESGPSRRLTRRVTSRQASQEPLNKKLEGEGLPQPPRRVLTRRAKAAQPVIIGIDDPSSIVDAVPDLSTHINPPPVSDNQPPVFDLSTSTPARSSRLKRRVGTGTQNLVESQIFSLNIEDPVEPPLKKFKALFEASDPDRTGAESLDSNKPDDLQNDAFSSLTQTQTQTQAQPKGSRMMRSEKATGLTVVREEEEEAEEASQSGMGLFEERDVRGSKRKGEVWTDTITAGEIAGSGEDSGMPVRKKRAMENPNAVERSDLTASHSVSPPVGSKPVAAAANKVNKPGAAPGKPDTDAAFLKAIASTKRGKKTEDSFDREFNMLKISKPDLGREEQEKEWAVLEDFGDETNLRGNFMVVLEMDVYRSEGRREKPAVITNSEWQTKPNFKKFKMKCVESRKNQVELVVSEENDYGMGAGYWKGGNSQSQSQGEFSGPGTIQRQSRPRFNPDSTRKNKNHAFKVDDLDDGLKIDSQKAKSKVSVETESLVSQKRMSTRTTNASKKSKPLFLDSDDSDEEISVKKDEEGPISGGDVDDEETQTLQSSEGHKMQDNATHRVRRTRKTAPTIVDDDSDDDAVFRGFRGKKRGG